MFALIFVRSLQSDLQIGLVLLFQERDSISRIRIKVSPETMSYHRLFDKTTSYSKVHHPNIACGKQIALVSIICLSILSEMSSGKLFIHTSFIIKPQRSSYHHKPNKM